jgi:O-antigen ligase
MLRQDESLKAMPRPLSGRRIVGGLALLTTGIVVVGLFATITNLIPLSVLSFAWMAFLLPLTLLSAPRLPKVTALASLYLMLSLGSVLIYDPHALITPDFYRYDGNFFVTFLPLLLLPILPKIKLDVVRVVKSFVSFALFISVAPAIYQYVTTGYSNGLFVATNAFGGFLMSIIAFIFSWWMSAKRKSFPSLIFLLALAMLILSSSRGSFLGVFLGIVCFMAIKRGHSWIPLVVISLIILIQAIIISLTYPLYINNKDGAYNVAVELSDSGKEANIYIRAYENWPRGFYLFSNSPLVGTGVGSANDFPLEFYGDKLFQTNTNRERIYDSAHAHNTYLHILGEQGIVGLILFLLMWISVYKSIYKRCDSTFVRDGLLITFWALTFASFTEHRIPSPSNAFPFILIYLLYYMNNPVFYTGQHIRRH